jgi:hypothetical protein
MSVINDPLARLFVVAEGAARVIKNHLRHHLRTASEKMKIPMEAPYRQVVVDLLNQILSGNDSSLDYWTRELVPEMKLRFSFSEFSLRSKSESWYSTATIVLQLFCFSLVTRVLNLQVCGKVGRFIGVAVHVIRCGHHEC